MCETSSLLVMKHTEKVKPKRFPAYIYVAFFWSPLCKIFVAQLINVADVVS